MSFDPFCYASNKEVFTKESKVLLLELLEAATYTSDMSEKLQELKETLRRTKPVAYPFDIVRASFSGAVGTEAAPGNFMLYSKNDYRAIVASARYVNSGETYSFSLGDESANYYYSVPFYYVSRENIDLKYTGALDKNLGNIITGTCYAPTWTKEDKTVNFDKLDRPVILVCNFRRNDEGLITDTDLQRLKESFSISIKREV